MYKEILIVGLGIYGLILTFGFISLGTLKSKDRQPYGVVNKALYQRILAMAGEVSAEAQGQGIQEPLQVRTVTSVMCRNDKAKAFPFLNDPRWNPSCQDTIVLDHGAATTELLDTGVQDTELLQSQMNAL